jgi:hypothetical protein
MLKRYWPFLFVVSVLGVLFIWAEEKYSHSFGKCIGEWADHGGKTEPNKDRFVIAKVVGGHALCAIEAIDRHNGFFAAIAAFIIAWFTWSLRQSTEKMWGETKKAADAADASAKAVSIVERAYVYPIITGHSAIGECINNARVFYLDDLTKDDVPTPETAEVTFVFKNFGKTPAILKEAFVGFGAAPLGALIGVSIVESVLASLEETSPLISQMQVGITRKQAQRILTYTGHVCFEGNVTFDDIWGNEHTTEFYFIWDISIGRMALRGVKIKIKSYTERDETDAP